MTPPHTLRSLLSISYLHEWAGDRVFQRGKAYFGENRVKIKHFSENQAVAEVEGVQPYRVEWTLEGKRVTADCTCPAMFQYGFCKHAVALGLVLLGDPIPMQHTQNVDAPADLFSERYPNLAEWVLDGWIEIGRNGCSTSPIRVCDEGGLVWEGGTRHKSMDNILAEADQAISEWMKEN